MVGWPLCVYMYVRVYVCMHIYIYIHNICVCVFYSYILKHLPLRVPALLLCFFVPQFLGLSVCRGDRDPHARKPDGMKGRQGGGTGSCKTEYTRVK
jgi:hypothetical protein